MDEPIANSSMLSLPSITAPSRQRCAVTVDFVGRLEAVENVAASLRVHALGRIEVLDAERQAFERTRVACGEARVAGLRHLQRLIGGDGDKGVEALRRLDRVEMGVRQFDAGDFARAHRVARLGEREEVEIGQDGKPSG